MCYSYISKKDLYGRMTMEPYQIREDFIRYGVRKEAKKNQYLFDPSREGCDNICFLDEGIAALTRINDDGEEHIYLYFGEKRLVASPMRW